jgi:hypothetical protein
MKFGYDNQSQHNNVSRGSVALTGIFNNLEPLLDSSLVEIVLDDCVYSSTQNTFDYLVRKLRALI